MPFILVAEIVRLLYYFLGAIFVGYFVANNALTSMYYILMLIMCIGNMFRLVYFGYDLRPSAAMLIPQFGIACYSLAMLIVYQMEKIAVLFSIDCILFVGFTFYVIYLYRKKDRGDYTVGESDDA